MAARVFSDPPTALDVYFVAPVFDPGAGAGGLGAAGARPASVERVDTFAAEAVKQVSRDAFGAKYPLAVIYLTAHMLSVDAIAAALDPVAGAGLGGTAIAAGPIASKSVGPISVSYAAGGSSVTTGGAAAFADEVLATTWFGKQFIALRRQTQGAAIW